MKARIVFTEINETLSEHFHGISLGISHDGKLALIHADRQICLLTDVPIVPDSIEIPALSIEHPDTMEVATLDNFATGQTDSLDKIAVSPWRGTLTRPLLPGTTYYASQQLAAGEFIYRYTFTAKDGKYLPDAGASRKGSLSKDVFFTSEREPPHIPSGFSAVGRLALPSPLPAWYRHQYRVARSVTPVTAMLGTVRPAFGQAGGGAEGFSKARIPVHYVGRHRLPIY